MPTSERSDNYWIDKLGRIEQGARWLPNVLPSSPQVAAHATAHCRIGDPRAAEHLGLAAFALVAGRYNGGEPLVIALPPNTDSTSFAFIAVGAQDPVDTVGAFLDRISAEAEESRRHAPCSLARLNAAFGFNGDGADTVARAILQLGFTAGPAAASAPSREAAEISINIDAQDTDATNAAGHTVRVDVRAKAGALAPEMTEHFAAAVARAIEWLSSNRNATIGSFGILSNHEHDQITRQFNDTRVAAPSGLTLHGLIGAQARRTPERIAVAHNNVELTYAAFDMKAAFLAALLRRDFRVTTGDRVGVMMSRSHHAVIALYGVMTAGAAYVPINPRHPWDTIRYMIENAGISVLIVDADSVAAASHFAGDLLVIDIELAAAPDRAATADANADAHAHAGEHDLAYVIYTSGSTGRPKGVAVEHRAIVNTVLWRNDFYGIGPDEVNLQIPSFAFDSSVVDIFCVLTAGGTLVVPDEELRLDAKHLLELSAARRITSCIVTPSYYRLLLSDLGGAVPSLRAVTLAGESATPELVARHLRVLPGVKLYNEYGPTENAVCSTACVIDVAEPSVSIGPPIWNVAVLVVDPAGRVTPIGVPGEMYLGGAGLARGYLNQDALTTERFVPSPAPDAYDGRMYKTGDRACWRPDGSLEFLGRLDRQVKVRGVRIELDDIELALRAHPAVRSGAVICKQDRGGANYLSAFVESHAPVSRTELRAHMAAALPSYMIPDAFTVVPQLPLNLNGKIDRAALALIDDSGAQPEQAAAAVSPVQAALLDLWADVLKRGQIALDDNFFTMGGNSLRVMELTSRIRGELSLDVELLDVYTYPTVRELADRLQPTVQ